MKTMRHEIEVSRGEAFTIDRILQNKDGSPYIISNAFGNPYFCLTVSSALYNQKNAYNLNIWLPVAVPRFLSTVPLEIESFTDSGGNPKYTNGFASLSGLPNGYIDGKQLILTRENDTMFYSSKDNSYKYFKDGKYYDYECRLIIPFTSDITKEWVEQNYLYSIDLVDGLLANEHADRPLSKIDIAIPILEPTSLTVKSNLKGGNRLWT